MTIFKWIYLLDGSTLPSREEIGGKAWSIARMAHLGLPVPPAFVVSADACVSYFKNRNLPERLYEELHQGIKWLEKRTSRKFGAGPSPLLVSVRSGAAISMPGMMDTILNLGINEDTMQALESESGDRNFARDTCRRFHEFYAQIVLKLPDFDLDPEAEPNDWRSEIEKSAEPVPQDPYDQLENAVRAVFDSWSSRRAKRYRKHHGIPDTLGTAVTVQAMVFGNLNQNSGTGVLFTRDPLTGSKKPYGEYLPQAQGEDVVSGKFTPKKIADLASSLPSAHKQLLIAADTLENENGDVQDIEFTVQSGNLFLLQSRTAKRAPAAAVRIAVEMANEGRISINEALSHITSHQVRSFLSPYLAENASDTAVILARGQRASPGVGAGVVVTDSDEAENRNLNGENIVLARPTTSPDDVHGMLAANAVITQQGGTTSHAAVVCRSLGLPCIVGCQEDLLSLAGHTVTVDGGRGVVYADSLEVIEPDERDNEYLELLLKWAEKASPLKVYRPSEQPMNSKLVELNGKEKTEELTNILKGYDGAIGGYIASDEGVAAALEAGLKFIVAKPTLPPLIAAISIQQDRNKS